MSKEILGTQPATAATATANTPYQDLAAAPSTFQTRVRGEATDLHEKLSKLHTFVDGEAFTDLPEIDQILLRTQLDFMNGYYRTLTLRIMRFED